jgi:hypothetical protein
MKDGVIYKNTLLHEMISPALDTQIKKTLPHMWGDYNYKE